MVLASASEVTVQALITDVAESWLLDQSALLDMDAPAAASVEEKDAPSCVGHCEEWMGVCGCDSWCIWFGDCCPLYYDICF